MFVPLVRPALLSGTAFDEDLLTLPVELSLALYPSPTSFLLHHFSSPELGQFSLEKRSCRGIFSVCKICAEGSNERRQSRSGTPQGVQRMDERQWTQTKAQESTLNIRKSWFMVKEVKHWIRFPRGCGDSILGHTQA